MKFTATAIMTVFEGGTKYYDPNGNCMGYCRLPDGLEMRFISTFKNGLPVGPEYAWRLDGMRFYWKLWNKDSKMIKYRQWDEDGVEILFKEKCCGICDKKLDDNSDEFALDSENYNLTLEGKEPNKTQYQKTYLNCNDCFHYKCIFDHCNRSNKCPTCASLITDAKIGKSELYLSKIVGRDPTRFSYYIEDILGNKVWVRDLFVGNFLGYEDAPIKERKQEYPSRIFKYNNKYNYIIIGDVEGNFGVIGNITLRGSDAMIIPVPGEPWTAKVNTTLVEEAIRKQKRCKFLLTRINLSYWIVM